MVDFCLSGNFYDVLSIVPGSDYGTGQFLIGGRLDKRSPKLNTTTYGEQVGSRAKIAGSRSVRLYRTIAAPGGRDLTGQAPGGIVQALALTLLSEISQPCAPGQQSREQGPPQPEKHIRH